MGFYGPDKIIIPPQVDVELAGVLQGTTTILYTVGT